jgi:hypothetical protein
MAVDTNSLERVEAIKDIVKKALWNHSSIQNDAYRTL